MITEIPNVICTQGLSEQIFRSRLGERGKDWEEGINTILSTQWKGVRAPFWIWDQTCSEQMHFVAIAIWLNNRFEFSFQINKLFNRFSFFDHNKALLLQPSNYVCSIETNQCKPQKLWLQQKTSWQMFIQRNHQSWIGQDAIVAKSTMPALYSKKIKTGNKSELS